MRIVKVNGNDCGGFQEPKGHLDTQMFPECKGTETDRNIVQKTLKRRKHKKNASKMSWPIVSHDAKGIWQKWMNKQLSDKDFVDKMDKLSKITDFPGVPDFPIVKDAIISALNQYRNDRDAHSAAVSIGHVLNSWSKVEEEESRKELVEAKKNFNLNQYRMAQRAKYVDEGSIIEGPDMSSISPSQLQMLKYTLEKKYPKINWTLNKIMEWARDNMTNTPAPFDKPKDIYHGE